MHAYYFLITVGWLVLNDMEEKQPQFRDIPRDFHSFEKEGLFTHCIECERDLLKGDCDYVIEKAFRNYQGFKAQDVIFDYAICMDCAMEIQKRMSKESMAKIQEYMQKQMMERQQELSNRDLSNVEELYSKCMFTDVDKGSCEEYQVFAFCRGDQMNLQMPPYMVSGPILDEISELLSDETRDELNGFFNKHFSPAPGMFEPDPRLILI